MRLTVDLLERVVPHVNPVREWELQLRGCKIPAIENTGGTKVCVGPVLATLARRHVRGYGFGCLPRAPARVETCRMH